MEARSPLSDDVAPGLFLGCQPEPARYAPVGVSGLSPRPALSRAQLMPACPALAFWRSGPVAGLCLLPRSQTLLGGAEGCGDRRPLPPPLTY